MLGFELATNTLPPLKAMPLGPSAGSPHFNTKLHAAETALLDQKTAPMIAQLRRNKQRYLSADLADRAFVRDPLPGEEGVSDLM